jgi:hypothetical protein
MKGLEDEADTARSQRRARRFFEPDHVERLRTDPDRAAVRGFEAGDAVQQGALANAGFADEGNDFAGCDGELQGLEQRSAGPGMAL